MHEWIIRGHIQERRSAYARANEPQAGECSLNGSRRRRAESGALSVPQSPASFARDKSEGDSQ